MEDIERVIPEEEGGEDMLRARDGAHLDRVGVRITIRVRVRVRDRVRVRVRVRFRVWAPRSTG